MFSRSTCVRIRWDKPIHGRNLAKNSLFNHDDDTTCPLCWSDSQYDVSHYPRVPAQTNAVRNTSRFQISAVTSTGLIRCTIQLVGRGRVLFLGSESQSSSLFNAYDIYSCNTYFINQNLILKNMRRTVMAIDKQVTECYGNISSTTASFCTSPYYKASGGGQDRLHKRLLQRNRLTPIEERRCTRHLPISQRGTMAAIGLFGSTSLTEQTQRPQLVGMGAAGSGHRDQVTGCKSLLSRHMPGLNGP